MEKINYSIIKKLFDKKTKRAQLGYIGVAIKKKRIKMNLTQENITDGVCSVSYLSKIENLKSDLNTIYVEDIMKKLDINFHEIKTVNSYVIYINVMLESLFFQDLERGKAIFDEVRKWDDAYFNNLIRIMYYILIKDLDNISKEYSELIKIKESIEPEEISLFVGLSFIVFYYLGETKETFLLANLALEKSTGLLFDVVNRYCFLFYQQIGYYDLARICFERHMKKCQIRGNNNDIINFSKKMAIFNHLRNKSDLEKYYFSTEEKVLLNAIKDLRNEKNNAVSILEDYKFDKYKKQAYLIKLVAYDYFNLDLNSIIECDYEFNLEEKMHYNVYNIKIKYGVEEMKNYLKNEILPYFEKRRDIEKYRFYSLLLIKELEKSARYKEALSIYKKRDNFI